MNPLLLLAQATRLERVRALRETLRHEVEVTRPGWEPWVLLPAVLFVLGWLLWRFGRRMKQFADPGAGPFPLFRSGMRAAGLGFPERRFLAQIARQQRLEHPAALLLASDHFNATTEAWLRQKGSGSRKRVERIRDRLFTPAKPAAAATAAPAN